MGSRHGDDGRPWRLALAWCLSYSGLCSIRPDSMRSILYSCFAVVAVTLVMPASVAAQREAQPTSAGLCWRSLAPDTGEQDGSGIAESTLTSTRSGEVWISRSPTGPNLLWWSNG